MFNAVKKHCLRLFVVAFYSAQLLLLVSYIASHVPLVMHCLGLFIADCLINIFPLLISSNNARVLATHRGAATPRSVLAATQASCIMHSLGQG